MADQHNGRQPARRKLAGIVGTPVTPFTDQNRVDGPTLQKLVDFLIRHGVNALALPMHVGENLNMSTVERQEVARLAVEVASGRVPVLVNTSLAGTDNVVALSRHAQSAGASGVVVITPYYWRPKPAALVDHFVTVASALEISVVAYNSPNALGVSITTDMLKELINRCPNLVGLKDASFDMMYFTEACRITKEMRPDFAVFAGIEFLLPSMPVGGAGSFSPCGEVAPRLVKSLYDACAAGDYERARPLQQKLSRLFHILKEGYPAGFKCAMEIMGRPVGRTRKPILPLDAAGFKRVEAGLESLGILSEEPHGW